MTSLFTYFDAWEPLLKARKAKGLDKWDRLRELSHKLQGKEVSAISFTCAHPSHAGEPVRHLLGSVEGNLHFLLGYGNPRFHIAPYHWQIIDPNLTEEEAVELSKRIAHPANPKLWEKAGIEAEDEGDQDDGEAHKHRPSTKRETKRTGIPVRSAAGTYVCYPEDGLVYGVHNGHYYRWDSVKDSFFAAQHPDVAEAMENASVRKSLGKIHFGVTPSPALRTYTAQYSNSSYDENVWSLVKSVMPKPGKILRLEDKRGETIFGVTTTNSVEFYDRAANRISVRLFDREHDHFDLTRDGNMSPAALLSFLTKHLKISTQLLSDVTGPGESLIKAAQICVAGEASEGWDDVPAEATSLEKSVVYDNGTMKVVHV
jgi:hypothetical protein